MCGRFTANVKKKEIEDEWNLSVPPEFRPRYNIAPTQTVGIITNCNPRVLSMFNWGLIYLRNKTSKAIIINAKAETLHEKPMFKNLILSSRCLIPATSWFEWMQNKSKQPYVIRLKNKNLFAMAGIWDTFIDSKGNETKTFAIITTQANKNIKHIHERMPLLVPKKLQKDWLSNNIEVNLIEKETINFNFDYYTVSSIVNNPKNDSESVLTEFRETLF